MMLSFHLVSQKLPSNFTMFSSLSIGESLSTNNIVFTIDWTNSGCSAPAASPSLSLIVCTILCLSGNVSIMWALTNYFNYSPPSEEKHLPSESFFISFCTIFVLVMSEWTPCTILPKIHLLCVVFISSVCDSRHLLVQSPHLEA